jgi:hypothetical protein
MCGNVTLVIATLGQTQLGRNEHLQSGVQPRVTLINVMEQHKTIYSILVLEQLICVPP